MWISGNYSPFKMWPHGLLHEKENMTQLPQHILHWLPVKSRIRFKLWTLVYKNLHGPAPVYIAEMCIKHLFNTENYQLRSAVRGELVVLLAKKVTLGRRAFRYAGPSLWNTLPQDIRDLSLSLCQFQTVRKTFLYCEVYNLLIAQTPTWWRRQ